MTRRRTWTLLSALALVALAISPVHAASEEAAPADKEYRTPIPLWITAEGGWLVPAGHEGLGLKQGGAGVGYLGLQMSPGFVLCGDVGLFKSRDQLSTQIVMIGLNGRLTPNIDMPTLYVQGGVGFYHVSYSVSATGAVPPDDRMRPGLSFAVGYDVIRFSRMTLGVLTTYHGIVVARSDALAFVAVSAYLSWRPAIW